MDENRPATEPVLAGRTEKRRPHSIRSRDLEWQRIEACAGQRGLTGPEFVRFAALAAVADGPPAGPTAGAAAGVAAGAAADRLAPLVERTFRAAYILASKLRADMLGAGREDALNALVAEARGLQADLIGSGPDDENR
ncbi:MAG: hypothetical protein OXM58_20950 [Rhodospirillaceae bacterium]|nr:hypothetical protein [Rhodospirillaceae bacterium]MDE0617241.1 hypothetical protein [Rhodospirillaceae bacterium]